MPDPEPDTDAASAEMRVVHDRDGVRFRVETVMTGLEIPWSLSFAPDGRLFVTERPGRVRIVDLSTFTSEVALTLGGVYAQGEAGLLGLALDPNFAQNNFVYLYYSAAVWRRSGQSDRALSRSRRPPCRARRPARRHSGVDHSRRRQAEVRPRRVAVRDGG